MSKMPNIFSTLSPSFRHRKKAAATVETPSTSALARGPDRKLAGLRPRAATFPLLSTNRRFAFPTLALLAALAATLLLLLPGGPVQGHDSPDTEHNEADHIHYAENGTDEVRDFDSTDPEGSGIEWNVRGVDAADFEIDSAGVLTFKESPDFENPTDRGLNLNPGTTGDEDFTDDGEFAPGDNNYQITVSATEVWDGSNESLPAKRIDIALTVIVGNANDPGTVTLQWLQPEVDTSIRATLTDLDGGITGTSVWTWYTSKVADPEVGTDFHWNAVTGDGLATVQTPTGAAQASVSSYTPQGDTVAAADDAAVDEGKHLRVRVVYEDAHGANKTVYGISMNPVRAEVAPGANASPDFEDDTDTRAVPESTAVDDPVGSPVTATDTDNDIVTYELIEAASPNDGDDEFFNIDQASGQIMVAQNLDFDAVGGRTTTATAGEYKVIVRATDPSGLADDITVTITAENANEDPIVTGRAELSVVEGTIDITDENAELVYTSLPDAPATTEGPEATNQQNEYVYTDPDYLDSIASWDLEGDDAGAFDHSGRFEPRYLQFKTAPDYENPTDLNRDNVYEVTLVATDTDPLRTGAGIGRVNVWVTVTNVNEAGMVVFTEGGETAYLNEMLVAEVQDPDDHGGDLGEPHEGIHIVNWQWSRSEHEADDADPFVDIVGATTNTYTPRDMDRGFYLRATAAYTDPLSDPDSPTTEADERIATTPEDSPSLRTEMVTTDNAVRVPPGPESAPTFDETGTAVTRRVAENTGPGGNVGAPVAAMAANTDETLAYTLEGTDAKYFNIDDMGQITVGGDDPETGDTEPGTDPELDYDDPMKKQRFSVTVKVEVTGGDTNQKAQVDVNIIVTDVNEPPELTEGETAVDDYPEIDEDGAPNTAAVETYVVKDPEGATISWDLRGADASFFTINGGVLRFVNPPDFEDPKDKAGANTATPDAVGIAPDDTGTSDNTYSVVVRAIASRASGYTGPAETLDTTVTVTVTNVDEKGEMVISLLQPEVNIPIMATLTDSDGIASGVTWVWEVSEVEASVLDIDTDAHWGAAPGEDDSGNTDQSYTPAGADLTNNPSDTTDDDPIDEDKYLRVTASYTDPEGADKTARAMSAYPVQARGLGAKNQSPDFEGDKVERSVAETAAVGDNVPGAVVATVRAPSSTDILTYGLRTFVTVDEGNTGLTAGSQAEAEADLAAFDIDKATGQITVAQELDFESRGAEGNRDGKYVLVATVTDPSNLGDSIVVVITAEDMNEDPVLSGRPELTIEEIDSSDEDADNPDFEDNTDPASVNVYNVVDEDRRAATQRWALEGEDAGEFQLIGEVGRTLVFKNQPDYENPADANGDNVYKVTVVTFDGHGGRGEFDVCIAVININEEGKITLRDEDGNELVQPYAQGPITADLTDPDGGVTDVMWVWSRAQIDPPGSGDDARNPIDGATSATYTPTNADTSYFLHVMATYMDAKNEEPGDTDDRTAEVTAAHAVLEVADLKRAPAFPDDATEVEVAENSPSTTYVGEAIVEAVDPDRGTTLIYTLEDIDEGDDAKFFALATVDHDNDDQTDEIVTRQIVVAQPLSREVETGDPEMWDSVDLDHEDDMKNTYTVELKASDGALDDTITVTITVTDRNEAPSVPMAASGAVTTPTNNAPEFPTTEDGARSVAENTAAGEDIGALVMATDADTGDTLTYTLGGTDMASFDIDSATGQLMTKAALDFETPVDADGDNAYEVTVTASDGTDTDTIDVTITVTDIAEGSELSPYDTDNSGKIEGPEVIQAVRDYFANDITGPEVIEVVKLYFAGRSN